MVVGLEKAAESALVGGARVASFSVNNQKYWAKRNTQEKQKYSNEIKCLRSFPQEEVNVPELIFDSGHFFVTIDNGIELEACLRGTSASMPLLSSAMLAVADMHKKGLAHGGLHMRNITFDSTRKIGFLDLEKGSLKPATIEAQAYDLVVFVWSMMSIDVSASNALMGAKDTYLQAGGPAWAAAEKWCRQRRWLRPASKPLQWHEARFKAQGKYMRYAAVPLVLDFFNA